MVRDHLGRQLGERTHIDWASWDRGPAISLLSWSHYRHLDVDFIVEEFHIACRVCTSIFEID